MFAQWSIAKKLRASFGALLGVMILSGVFTLYNLRELNRAYEANENSYELMRVANRVATALLDIEAGERGFIITGEESDLAPYHAGRESFKTNLDALKRLSAGDGELQARLSEIERLGQSFIHDIMEKRIAERRQVSAGTLTMDELAATIRRGAAKAAMETLRQKFQAVLDQQRKQLAQRKVAAAATRRLTYVEQAIASLFGAILAIGLSAALGRNLGKRLRSAVDVAQETANGNLAATIRSEGSDELAAVLKALARMQERLREMMAQIQRGASDLALASGEISSTSRQLSDTAQEQSASASSMAAAMEELTVSINHVADNAREAQGLAQQSEQRCEHGGAVIHKTVDDIRNIADTVQRVARSINELGEHSNKISSIVHVIKEIADQTNLLALNAAIEAARAGEQGRGFAVVADEVRKLAERTSASTAEITDMTQRIQDGTRSAVQAMEEGVRQVTLGVELANEAGASIGAIRGDSGQVLQVVNDISQALKEQSLASNDVANNVERIARMSEENSAAVSQTSQTAERLKQLADHLEATVKQFRLA